MADDADHALGKPPGIVRLSVGRGDRRASLHGYAGKRTRSWRPGGPETRGITGCCIRSKSSRLRIHPFIDGNGRTTRLLADLVFTASQDGDAIAEQYDWEVDKGEYIRLLREHQVTRDPKPLAAFNPCPAP